MTEYFLFYKHYNIAWSRKNLSYIILPNGSAYSYNNPESNEDILGYQKGDIPQYISLETLEEAIKIGAKTDSNKSLGIDVQYLKSVELIKYTSSKISDGGFELYALFKYDVNQSAYEYIPLQILGNYYFRNFENDSYQSIINTIDAQKINMQSESKPSNFYKEISIDDDSFIGLESID
ncbi:hypothetical protein [Sphingobacterium composti Ten et al. 2007 non Yoo et al. 2007]|uniref:hypothetical protein n=1 Tax=Sphingobacterium composti TaxID=363260 RepID=UPI00135AF3E0|nr:hypothetical protein [Sphingobacterium composti Ten et al. 2007 non Yoo et al. 2007]